MSKYTTGEIAKLCNITVRTVQYYDTRGILIPSELTEGGRRMYSEDDVRKLRVICFLRETGLPIETIREILEEKDSSDLILLLLEQQEKELKNEIAVQEEKLRKMEDLQAGLKKAKEISVESIGDIAYTMKNKKKLSRMNAVMLMTGIPISVLQWGSIVLWALKGIWWPFALWGVLAAVYAFTGTRYYYKHVAYLCPQCHTVFKPTIKEFFFAGHTPTTRKLTCPQCKRRGYCLEVPEEENI